MSNYIKKYDLGTIKVDLPYASHIHELPLLHFHDFRGSVDINLIYNRKLFGNNHYFNLPDGYKLNIQKKIYFDSSTNKPIEYVDSDGTVVTLINNNNNIYTFDDESQRILRPITDGYEVEYSDFSKEIYDLSGNIVQYIDKYGDEVFTYIWESNRLRVMYYRNSKNIVFQYDSSDINIVAIEFYKDINYYTSEATTTLQYTNGNLNVEHYSGVLFKMHWEENVVENTLTYFVEAADKETPTTVLYSKECKYDENNMVLSYKEGSNGIDTMSYQFQDCVVSDGNYYNQVEVTNKKGVKQRLQYRYKKLMYSYEVNDDAEFNGNKFAGTVNIYNTIDNLEINSANGPLTIDDGVEFQKENANNPDMWYKSVTNYSNVKGFFLLTGWIKHNLTTANAEENKIYIANSPSNVIESFYANIYPLQQWHFFAYKFYADANYIYVYPYASDMLNGTDRVELKDLRLTYKTTEITDENNETYISLNEDVLISISDDNVTKIPLKDVTFYSNGKELTQGSKSITVNDIIKYKTKVKKEGSSNEIYYNNCKGVINTDYELQVYHNGSPIEISNYYVGTRGYYLGKEHWSYMRFDGTNIKKGKMVNSTIITSQHLNDYLDTIETYNDGITTEYTLDKGLIVREEVPYIYERNTEYIVQDDSQSNNIIKFTDEFGNVTKHYMDKVWGSIVKIELPDGNFIVNTLDDDKSVITKITFGTNSTDINNNFSYTKGNLSSVESGDLKYDYTYDNRELIKVEKYQNDTTTPKYILQQAVHTNNSTTVNYSDAYSMVYNYDKYDRLLSIDGVLENTYDIDLYQNNTTISNGSAYLVKQEDKLTGIIFCLSESVDLDTNKSKDYIKRYDSTNQIINQEIYEYDDANRLMLDTYQTGTNLTNNYISSIEYNTTVTNDYINDRIKKYTYKNNDTVLGTSNYFYDSYKRLYAHNHILENKTFTKSYNFYQTRILNEESSTGELITFNYDNLGRIAKSSSYLDSKNYYYDKYGRLIREDNQLLDKTFSYEYNDISNIVSKKTYSYTISEILPTPTSTINYIYDSVNPDRLTSYGSKTITYNGLGYPETYNGYNLTWDNGKLVNMSKGNIQTGLDRYVFAYNALGQRTEKTFTKTYGTSGINSVSPSDIVSSITKYEYDNQGRLLFETINITYYSDGADTKKIEYIYDQNSIIGMRYSHGTNANLYYFNRNIFGDVTEIYDTSGTLVAKYAYDAYGNCTIKQYTNYTIANANPIRYRGYYYDVETNLALVSSRYYSPELGRFIQPADVSSLNPQSINGLNLYAYANNNPISFSYNNSSATSSTSIGGGLASSIGAGSSSNGNVNSGSPSKGGLNLGWLKNGLDTGSTIHGLYTSISGLVNHTAYFAKNLVPFSDDMTMIGASMKDGVLAFNQFSWGLGKADVFGIALGVGLDIYDSIQRGVSPGGVVLGATLTAAKGVGLIYLNKGIMYAATAIGSCFGPVGTAVGFVVGGIVCIVVDIFASNWLDDLIDKIAK